MIENTKAHLLQMMLNDALDAVKTLYGDVGLCAVIEQMRLSNGAREHNAELDEIENTLTSAYRATET